MAFTPTIFGPDLARILNTLAAVHVEESKRFNRLEQTPLMGVFTNPVGTSWFEADMLTRHFYANHESLADLLACNCVPGARETLEWHPGDALGLTMLQTRQMLLARFVEVASSLQAGVSPALASVLPQPAAPPAAPAPPLRPVQMAPMQLAEPATRWPLRQHAPLYGMIRQTEPAPPPPPPPRANAPLPMQPWRCPVMVPISFFQDQGRAWELMPPAVPCPQFRRAGANPTGTPGQWQDPGWEPMPSRESSLAPSEPANQEWPNPRPSPMASPGQIHEDAMDTGSRQQSPRPPSPTGAPVAPPRREPRWLVPRADSVPPATPGSDGSLEQRARLEPPNLTDAGYFAGGGQEE